MVSFRADKSVELLRRIRPTATLINPTNKVHRGNVKDSPPRKGATFTTDAKTIEAFVTYVTITRTITPVLSTENGVFS